METERESAIARLTALPSIVDHLDEWLLAIEGCQDAGMTRTEVDDIWMAVTKERIKGLPPVEPDLLAAAQELGIDTSFIV